jgi:hypothetical protein
VAPHSHGSTNKAVCVFHHNTPQQPLLGPEVVMGAGSIVTCMWIFKLLLSIRKALGMNPRHESVKSLGAIAEHSPERHMRASPSHPPSTLRHPFLTPHSTTYAAAVWTRAGVEDVHSELHQYECLAALHQSAPRTGRTDLHQPCLRRESRPVPAPYLLGPAPLRGQPASSPSGRPRATSTDMPARPVLRSSPELCSQRWRPPPRRV